MAASPPPVPPAAPLRAPPRASAAQRAVDTPLPGPYATREPAAVSPLPDGEPDGDCQLCPRLAAFRAAVRAEHPDWWAAPVPALGDPAAWLAIAGLAPGMHGANRTGRPFTGDHAGVLLFETLMRHGLARGHYGARVDDGLKLTGAVIINAVKCLPPDNKPTPAEAATCRRFLTRQVAALGELRVIVALGRIAHDSILTLAGARKAAHPFGHAAVHRLPATPALPTGVWLVDSYHCSRYNQNTGRLTPAMFDAVFEQAARQRDVRPE